MHNNTFECPFCIEECNNSNKIICPHCQYYCCINCAERYLKDQKVAYICPNPECKKGWDFTFIYKNFPKKFIDNDLKKSYAEMCYVIDTQQFLPQYTAEVNFCKKLNKVYQILIDNKIDWSNIFDKLDIDNVSDEEISNIKPDKLQILIDIHSLVQDYISLELLIKIFSINYNEKLYLLYLYYNIFKNNINNVINHYHIKRIDYHCWFILIYVLMDDNEQDKCRLKINEDKYCISELFKNMQNLSFQKNYENFKNILKKLNINYQENINNQSICKCFENFCDGDISAFNDNLICNLCKKIFCSKCHKEIHFKTNEKQEEIIHECKQEDIDTVKMLTENVKKCPNCIQRIKKDGGCDHMWCPKCGTMFNWSDLKITKTTTNPHYFQWLRQTGRAVPRLNHPDADPYYNCNIQLNREQCINIINKYVNNNLLLFKNFASLTELKMIENNNDEMNFARAEYAFGIIDNKEFSNKISTYYMDKFFTDNYNMIVVNTIYMVSELFKTIEQNGKINNDILTSMTEIINIHNDGTKNIHDMYPSIKVQMINTENYNSYYI